MCHHGEFDLFTASATIGEFEVIEEALLPFSEIYGTRRLRDGLGKCDWEGRWWAGHAHTGSVGFIFGSNGVCFVDVVGGR